MSVIKLLMFERASCFFVAVVCQYNLGSVIFYQTIGNRWELCRSCIRALWLKQTLKNLLALPTIIIFKINCLKKELLIVLANTFACTLLLSLWRTESSQSPIKSTIHSLSQIFLASNSLIFTNEKNETGRG